MMRGKWNREERGSMIAGDDGRNKNVLSKSSSFTDFRKLGVCYSWTKISSRLRRIML